MSFKKRKPNKSSNRSSRNKSEHAKVDPPTSPWEYESESVSEGTDTEEAELCESSDRFLLVKEIAARCGVGSAAVRKWNREGKLHLRKLFDTTGPYGMAESQFNKLIRGEKG